jgi:diguanylate cyclase (GGDEF)-like protein/PAS domain S-box-containing protein
MLREIALLALFLLAACAGWLAWRARSRQRESASGSTARGDFAECREVAELVAGLGAWSHDLRRQLLRWSPGACRIFGIAADAQPPSPSEFADRIPEADRERWLEALRAAVREERELKIEFRYRRPDDRSVWVRASLRPRFEDGRVVRLSGVVQDITAMRTMQRKLSASEAKYRELTQLNADWVWETDAAHRFTNLSDSIASILGSWATAMCGKTPWEIPARDFLRTDWDGLRERFEQHLPIHSFEHGIVSPDGRLTFLEIRGRPMYDARGSFLGYRGTARNISQERSESLFLSLENRITAAIRDSHDAGHAIHDVIASVCGQLGLIGGLRIDLVDDGVQPGERAGSPVFLQTIDTLVGPIALTSDAPEQRALADNRHLWLETLDHEPAFRTRYRCGLLGARAALLVPITGAEGPSGSLLVLLSPVSFRDDGVLSRLANTLQRALVLHLRRAEAEQRLLHASLHDPLTGLPNRAHLEQVLDRRLARNEALAVLYVDLDRYKIINDTLGHSAGDRALIEVAGRLQRSLRPQDLAARLGGDEFVAVLAGELAHDEIEQIARGMLAAIERPLPLGDRAWLLSASIGVALAPSDARETELLVRYADNAMYEVKAQGRNDIRFFSGRLSTERAEHLRLAAELPLALETGQVLLHYQPIMAIAERRVVGIEALLRWRHPELGLLAPERFLQAAEQANLKRELGLWMLRQALDDGRRLGLATQPDLTVSVNVSARQLADDDLPARIEALLSERELPARLLRIELAESALLVDPERTAKMIDTLRATGVRVIIDNFGTGYASLSWLRQLPVDGLKIDSSFIRDLPGDRGKAAIVEAITTMASRLGLEAMVEGVDSAAQLRALRALNCNQIQGGLIADPMPVEEIADFLDTLPALREMHVAPSLRRAG